MSVVKAVVGTSFLLLLAACAGRPAVTSSGAMRGASSPAQEEYLTAPTVTRFETGGGEVVEQDLGVRTFSETALHVMDSQRVSAMKVNSHGDLIRFTIHAVDPSLDLPDGEYVAGRVWLSAGVLMGASEEFTSGCQIKLTIRTDPNGSRTVDINGQNDECASPNVGVITFDEDGAYGCECRTYTP